MTNTYRGLVAEGYDLYLRDVDFGDVAFFADLVREHGTPALDVGCGTGRVMLDLLAQGLEVDGLDISDDMLAVCRRKARERSLNARLFCQPMQSIDLDRRYRCAFCAAGSLACVYQRDDALKSLLALRRHLEPGGVIAITMYVPDIDLTLARADDSGWFLRREAVREDGAVLRCWQHPRFDRHAQLEQHRMRNEVVVDGVVVASTTHDWNLRWWTPSQLGQLAEQAGYDNIRLIGGFSDQPAREASDAFTLLAST